MTSTSAAQISANRANAQLSTGPKTPEGKAKMAANPLRHGLTSAQLIVPGENESDFLALLAYSMESNAPVGDREIQLVQKIAEQEWRLLRIARVENATLTMYIREYLEEAQGDEALASALAYRRHGKEFDRFMRYEKTIRNLRKDLRETLFATQDLREQDEAAAALLEQQQAKRAANEADNARLRAGGLAALQIPQSQPLRQNGSVSQNAPERPVATENKIAEGVVIE